MALIFNLTNKAFGSLDYYVYICSMENENKLRIDFIERHFQNHRPLDKVMLSDCEVVGSGELFVMTTIVMLRHNYDNKRMFNPAMKLLNKYYRKCLLNKQ